MSKQIYTYFLVLLLVLGFASQGSAATEAAASIGETKPTIGKYDVSDMTEDEKEWFLTFLQGNFFADGWDEISAEILTTTLDQEREQQKTRLDELGYKIGREWCKGNSTRKIHTSMLREWGSQLKDTAEEKPHLLTEVIERIDKEVDELVN